MGQRTSVYLDDDFRTAAKASGVPLAELVRRSLAASTAPTRVLASAPLGALDDGEPGPRPPVRRPGCLQRDTRKYGLRQLPSAQPAPQP